MTEIGQGRVRGMAEKRTECPYNHTRMCPHRLIGKDVIWCQVCVLTEILREIRLLSARSQ